MVTERGRVEKIGGTPHERRTRLLRELPDGGRFFTYNGHCFDLPCIRDQLGIDLHDHFQSVDLRWVCQKNGITGGQKRIERRFSITRKLPEMDGLDAIALWDRSQQGDEQALCTLLLYNAEDINGLVTICRYLSNRGMVP